MLATACMSDTSARTVSWYRLFKSNSTAFMVTMPHFTRDAIKSDDVEDYMRLVTRVVGSIAVPHVAPV